MRKLAFAFVLLLSSPTFAAENYLIPVAQPGSVEYTRIRTWLDLAAGGHSSTELYNRLNARGVSVETAVVITVSGENSRQMPMTVNGLAYWIPLQFSSVDNYSHLESRPKGIYFIQRGFRTNPKRPLPDRVDVSIRVSGPNGESLNAIEYREEVKPALK